MPRVSADIVGPPHVRRGRVSRPGLGPGSKRAMAWLCHDSISLTPMRILIADDNAEARDALVQSFAHARDRQLTSVADGVEAWWHLSKPDEHYDLAILDVAMASIGGLELL